jgi:hypothetical protein
MNPLANYAIRGDGTAETAERIRKVFEKVGGKYVDDFCFSHEVRYYVNPQGAIDIAMHDDEINRLTPISIDQAEEIVFGEGEPTDQYITNPDPADLVFPCEMEVQGRNEWVPLEIVEHVAESPYPWHAEGWCALNARIKSTSPNYRPRNPAYQNLFEALQNVCGFTALQSDMDEIIRAVEKDRGTSGCDVCGSENITEAPHMGRNFNECNPL